MPFVYAKLIVPLAPGATLAGAVKLVMAGVGLMLIVVVRESEPQEAVFVIA